MNELGLKQSEENMLADLSKMAEKSSKIKPELYGKYEVKRGLRDLDGKGVLVGLTEIGEVHSYIGGIPLAPPQTENFNSSHNHGIYRPW